MKRWLDVVLVLVALVGLAFAVQQAVVRQSLSRQYELLAAEVGYLEPTGGDGVHVIALPTPEPGHFRWRIHVPADEKIYWKNRRWGPKDHEIPLTGPRSFIANVRFRNGEDGTLRVWWGFEGTTVVHSLRGNRVQELLDGRWDEMQVEQLASDEQILMKPGELKSLLRITMPDQMREEAQKVLSPEVSDFYVPEFFHLQLGVEKTGDGQSVTDSSSEGAKS